MQRCDDEGGLKVLCHWVCLSHDLRDNPGMWAGGLDGFGGDGASFSGVILYKLIQNSIGPSS